MTEKSKAKIVNSSMSGEDKGYIIANQSWKCCQFSPSAYTMYVANLLFFVTMGINKLMVLDSVIYNKLCYIKYKNMTLCTNSTFTSNHPALQVKSYCEDNS